ncbi:hypothetical protein ACFQ1S_35470 [Kibdelosporangium lantanae]|uniref:Major facilitator superfamily (MFS) profile domain-containing protein n=1 Tax=Kibdelosporangium lantanae TaxID=1497396 RepID=A0ABW3MI73_9PSEU
MSVVAMTHARFTPRQRAVLLVLLGAGFMLSVDFSILNVALPEIGAGVSLDVASLVAEIFTEVIVAPSYADGAVDILSRKKNTRTVLAFPGHRAPQGIRGTAKLLDYGACPGQPRSREEWPSRWSPGCPHFPWPSSPSVSPRGTSANTSTA